MRADLRGSLRRSKTDHFGFWHHKREMPERGKVAWTGAGWSLHKWLFVTWSAPGVLGSEFEDVKRRLFRDTYNALSTGNILENGAEEIKRKL